MLTKCTCFKIYNTSNDGGVALLEKAENDEYKNNEESKCTKTAKVRTKLKVRVGKVKGQILSRTCYKICLKLQKCCSTKFRNSTPTCDMKCVTFQIEPNDSEELVLIQFLQNLQSEIGPVSHKWSDKLGIDWTHMESRASSEHWLTNRFIPVVLSPLMVRIETVIKERYLIDFYQNIAIGILLTGMVVALVAISLLATFRQYMARKMKKVQYLAKQLKARNGTAAATAMLSTC